MNQLTLPLRKRLLYLLIPALVGMVYLGTTVSSFYKKVKDQVTFTNRTKSCEVVGAERHQGRIKLVLRNNSDKAITAFVITCRTSPRDVFSVKVEFAYSENDFSIVPGSTYEKVFGLDSEANNRENPTLDLSAVIFDDKSSEGNSQIVQAIEDERLAEKIELLEVMPLLDKMLKLRDDELPSYLKNSLNGEVSAALNLSKKDVMARLFKERPYRGWSSGADELPEPVRIGLQSAKEYISQKTQYLQNVHQTQGTSVLRDEIRWVKQTYEKMIERL
jgi:hypothetical protein